MRQLPRTLMSVLAASVILGGAAHPQSAQDVLSSALSAYERRLEGVQNYTIVQEVMGFESVMYFEKTNLDGRPIVQLRRMRVGGRVIDNPGGDDAGWERFYALLPQMAEHARYVRGDQIHGVAVHVLEITELDQLGFVDVPQSEDAEFIPENATVFIDGEQWVVRRVEFEGTMVRDGQRHPVRGMADMTDYREVDGLLHPFLVTVEVHGLAEAMGVDEEQRAELRAQLEQMKKQIEQLPEAQRQMMENMMRERMDQMEQMLGGDDGDGMTVEVRVKELRVNAGPPGA